MSVIVPDLDWYTNKSREQEVASRCPFATVNACPRYYQSLSLLGDAGSTRIEEKEDKRLLKQWKKSDLWPKTREQDTEVSGSNDKNKFIRFCPEVAFERFKYFATTLLPYADGINRDAVHKTLREETRVQHDWRGTWALVEPQHYTDCPLFSVLERQPQVQPLGKDPWYKNPIFDFFLTMLKRFFVLLG